MSGDDDRRATDRFVAGLPVDPDELATAVSGRALQRSIVVDAMLRGLASEEPTVRLRVARRIARMPDLAPRLEAALRAVALEDDDARVREAGTEALRTHTDAGEAPAQPPAERRLPAALVTLRLLTTRSGEHDVVLNAEYPDEAPDLVVEVVVDPPEVRLTVRGLPAGFVGTRPELHVLLDPSAHELTPVGQAETPVSDQGKTSIRFAAPPSLDELERWFRDSAELVVPSD